jgi:hypothetical protein
MNDLTVSRREYMWLSVAVVLSLMVHAMFAIRGFGEMDAARIAFPVAVWSMTGSFPYIDYLRVTPLYIQVLKLAVSWGLPIAALPGFMCTLNVIFGSLCLVPMYLIWRRVADATTAAMALILLSFMPTFWLGNIYGMPHIVALFFMLLGFYCFSHMVQKSGTAFLIWFAVSLASLSIAMGMKADVLVCFGALLWFVFRADSFRVRNTFAAAMMPAVATCSAMALTRVMSPDHVSAREFYHRFPFTLEAITDLGNVSVLVLSPGLLLSAVITSCAVYCIAKRRHLPALGLVLIWALPPLLFWGLRPGNLARHMLAGYAVLPVIVAIVVTSEIRSRRLSWTVFVLLIIANYFITPWFSLPRTGSPGSRLFEAQRNIQARVDNWHETGKAFAALPDESKEIRGLDWIIYAAWETLLRSDKMSRQEGFWRVTSGNRQQEVRFIYPAADEKPKPADPGWSVYLWVDDGRRSRIEPLSASAYP